MQDDAKVSVSVTASELGMLGVNAGTYVQGSEATAEATLNIRNYIGYAEKISLSVEQGISNSNVYSIRLQVPRILRIPYQMDLRIHQVFDNKVKWSSYTERLRGLSCSFMRYVSVNGHNFSLSTNDEVHDCAVMREQSRFHMIVAGEHYQIRPEKHRQISFGIWGNR